MALSFTKKAELSNGLGRTGTIETAHGPIQTPAFAVVGTKGTVKALTVEQVQSTGAQVVLANTYHLYLQPGDTLISEFGGVGPFMHWGGPTMTDSGGFQVFSLGAAYGTSVTKMATADAEEQSDHQKLCAIDEEGVTFRSHIDGSEHRFTPERSMEIQWNLGADIIFAFDECTSPLAPHAYQEQAMHRTHRWAERCLNRHEELDTKHVQSLFGVVQGGRHQDLRIHSAKTLAALHSKGGASFDGFGIGGSFTKEDMGTAVRWVNEVLPEEKPRHLLGIGEPGDIFVGVENGCDLFDCVAPTRNARTGTLYTYAGPLHIERAAHKSDAGPIDDRCTCYTCTHYSRAYLHHLFKSKEMLAATLASIHNVAFIVKLIDDIRSSIQDGTFFELKEAFLRSYYSR